MKVPTRWFTLSEANAMLPELIVRLRELQALTRQFEELYDELQHKKAAAAGLGPRAVEGAGDPYFELEGRLDFLRMEAELLIGNFERQGVMLKMINPGLLDFPAKLNGEAVLICWKEGEERVTHYHGWHEGFKGRRTFPEA